MDKSIQQLMFDLIDEQISDEDFQRLQELIEDNEQVRLEYLRTLRLVHTLGDLSVRGDGDGVSDVILSQQASASRWDLRSPGWISLAATVLALASLTAFWLGQRNQPESNVARSSIIDNEPLQEESLQEESLYEESLIAGHATLRRSVDLVWTGKPAAYREGDVLPQGLVEFRSGVAEFDFFSGATLIVEGPASLFVESDWEVRVDRGRLRAHVPPAARGFVVKTAGSEIVDLGTEFALEVESDNAQVKVIDGEVALRGGEHDGDHLLTGQSLWLLGQQNASGSLQDLSTNRDVDKRVLAAEAMRLQRWSENVEERKTDSRLIAYYPIALGNSGRVVPNLAPSGDRSDGTIIGPVDEVAGRFGRESSGLEFDRLGARVRTRIDGTFSAYTFTCWVRIDSLKHRYNALFMADGYENGEPHWQIRDDGSLMFSVMVDDSQEIRHYNKMDDRIVRDAGLHRVYYTEPIWDLTKTGQWFHLAAVYDPANRIVSQYVNGERLGHQEIIDKFFIDELKIGPAEIGNWGQPFRKTPWFAVRNLHGTIDELSIYDAALSEGEIQSLYQVGKPLGY